MGIGGWQGWSGIARKRWAVSCIALAMLASACSDEVEEGAMTTTSTVASSTTAEPRAETDEPRAEEQPEEANGVRPLPSSGELEPGTYQTEGMDPAVTLTVGADWSVLFPEVVDNVALGYQHDPRASPAEAVSLGLVRLTNTHDDPYLPYSVMSGPGKLEHIHPVPDDLPGWLGAIPGVTVTGGTTTSVGGIDAEQFDVQYGPLPPEAASTCPPGLPPCAALLSVNKDAEFLGFFEGVRNRWWVMRVGEQRLLAILDAPPDRFDAVVGEVERVLNTLQVSSESG